MTFFEKTTLKLLIIIARAVLLKLDNPYLSTALYRVEVDVKNNLFKTQNDGHTILELLS